MEELDELVEKAASFVVDEGSIARKVITAKLGHIWGEVEESDTIMLPMWEQKVGR